MDDLALLDMLECPLCLEPLDVTAKVLPCQHTFCKLCLQRQEDLSRAALRCPECRSPVPGAVEELPINALLVRLLEGVQHGPVGPGKDKGHVDCALRQGVPDTHSHQHTQEHTQELGSDRVSAHLGGTCTMNIPQTHYVFFCITIYTRSVSNSISTHIILLNS